jgi:hypothetical protein
MIQLAYLGAKSLHPQDLSTCFILLRHHLTHNQKRTSGSTAEATVNLILPVNVYRLQDVGTGILDLVDKANIICVRLYISMLLFLAM